VKLTLEVENREEGELIRDGLGDPIVRAFVKIMGALSRVPSDRAKARILRYVSDKIDEERGAGGES
jgi:hypothetical protein